MCDGCFGALGAASGGECGGVVGAVGGVLRLVLGLTDTPAFVLTLSPALPLVDLGRVRTLRLRALVVGLLGPVASRQLDTGVGLQAGALLRGRVLVGGGRCNLAGGASAEHPQGEWYRSVHGFLLVDAK